MSCELSDLPRTAARPRAGVLFVALLCILPAVTASSCRRGGTAKVQPDVLLVTLDTTRADHVGAYGGPPRVSAHLDALAARAVVFERAFAVAPMTLPAHATILTGRLPLHTGVRWNGEQKLPAAIPTLPERFAAAGYATGAFVSAAVLDRAFGLERGFDVYDDEVGRQGEFWRAERSGAESARRALAWLETPTPGRPVFLWLHLFEPHDPYSPPAPFAETFRTEPYLGEIAAADAALGSLLAHPRWQAGAGGIVAVLGDHGESLGEHGEQTHGILVHDGVLHVPFLLAGPGLTARRCAAEVSQADLAPTLLELAGLPALDEIDGTSLLADLASNGSRRARTLYAESLYGRFLYGWAPLRSTRHAGWKWIAGARGELFDTGMDPAETTDLAAGRPAEASALDRALRELERTETVEADPAGGAVDAKLSERLRSLGYLGGGDSATPPGDADAAAGDPRDVIAVHERMRRADAELRAGRIEAAQEELRRVLLENPDNRMANLAVERQLRASLDRSEEKGTSTGTVVLRTMLAQALVAQGRRDEARGVLVQAADVAVASGMDLNARAFARLELGRVREARADWQALAAREPESSEARLNLASLFLSLRDFAAAERWAREAVTLEPGSAAAHNSLAIALEEQGRAPAAREHYRDALALAPDYWQAQLNLGLLEARLGHEEVALGLLEKVLERVPREPLARLAIGRLMAGRPADRAAAREHLEIFLEVAPSHPAAAEARRLLTLLPGGQDSRGGARPRSKTME